MFIHVHLRDTHAWRRYLRAELAVPVRLGRHLHIHGPRHSYDVCSSAVLRHLCHVRETLKHTAAKIDADVHGSSQASTPRYMAGVP